MKVKSIMNGRIATCRAGDPLRSAAQVMWDRDCGVVPVVADDGRLAGVVTDRDIAMATMLANRSPHELRVGDVMAHDVCTCAPDDDVREVHALMRDHQIRRIPVVDGKGVLVGLVSLNDLALEAFGGRSQAAQRRQRDVARTLSEISQHREPEEEAAEA